MRLVTAGCDNRIRFWKKKVIDVAEGDETSNTAQWEIDAEGVCGGDLRHSDWVRDVAWAPAPFGGQDVVASCSEDGTVFIWTKNTTETVWIPTLLNKFDAPVWRLSWSLTGNILAVSSGDTDVTLWKQAVDGSWLNVSTVQDTQGLPSGHQTQQ